MRSGVRGAQILTSNGGGFAMRNGGGFVMQTLGGIHANTQTSQTTSMSRASCCE